MDPAYLTKSVLLRSVAGGSITAVVSLLIGLIIWGTAHTVGLPTGPDDVKKLCQYGFVVGCFVWAFRAKPRTAAVVTGGVSAAIITLVLMFLMSYVDHPLARQHVETFIVAILVYSGVPALAAYIGARLCAHYLPPPEERKAKAPATAGHITSHSRK